MIGDFNYNGISCESADLVMFTDCMLSGFRKKPMVEQVSSPENDDGESCCEYEVAPPSIRFYYLLHAAVRGAVPCSLLAMFDQEPADSVVYTVLGDTVYVLSPDSIGAALLVYTDTVVPEVLSPYGEMLYRHTGSTTRVLLRLSDAADARHISAGPLLYMAGAEPIEVQAAAQVQFRSSCP